MHILASILGAIGVLIVILWRLQQAASIARDVADAAGGTGRAVRRWRWWRKVNVNPIDLIDDPREAASVLMVAVARADGDMSDTERKAITDQIEQQFGATPEQSIALFTRANWMVREGVDTREIMRRVMPVLQQSTTAEQRCSLIEMLNAIATADGRHDEMTTFDIYHFSKKLGV